MYTKSAKKTENKINIRIVKNSLDFNNLKYCWDKLSSNMPPFCSYDWLFKWWNVYSKNNDLMIIVAEYNGNIAGIAPLYVENFSAINFLKLKKLSFLGSDLADYSDFIIENSDKRDIIFESLFRYILQMKNIDTLDFRRINSRSPNFDLWNKFSRQSRFKFLKSKECPFLNLYLYKNYDEYYGQLSKSLKRNLITRANKLKNDGLKQEITISKDITAEDIELIAKINKQRQAFKVNQGDLKRFCYFSDINKKKFIQKYFCNNTQNNTLLAYLKLNDTVVSYILALEDSKSIYYWNTAVNPEYLNYAPSKFLIASMIEYAFDNNKQIFDFLRGKSPYKQEWSNGCSVNYDLLFNKSLTAKFIALYRSIKPEFLKKKYTYELD